jgi:hypothetical protein
MEKKAKKNPHLSVRASLFVGYWLQAVVLEACFDIHEVNTPRF